MTKIIDYTGMATYTDEVKKLIRQYIAESATDFEIVNAVNYLNFPITGSEDKLYVDQTNNKLYRWNDSDLKYYCVGSNYDDIGLINANWT